jgi:hypothetical protein
LRNIKVELMRSTSRNPFFNKRGEPRHPYSGFVSFVYKKKLNEGSLKNWSRSGLCMKTTRFFRKGDVITVSLPTSKYKNNNRKARIVWNKADGCGLQFCDE